MIPVVRFEDVVAEVLPYTTWSSMGTDVADLDGDGLLDLLVADMSATTYCYKDMVQEHAACMRFCEISSGKNIFK